MIVTPGYAIGHLPRTGGDAVHQIFHALLRQEVISYRGVFVDDIREIIKHATFHDRGVDPVIRVLFLRKLPEWELSCAQFRYLTYGDPVLSGAELARRHQGETWLLPWLKDPAVNRWLRTDHLREDLAKFLVEQHGGKVESVVWNTSVKLPERYDHDWTKHFDEKTLAALYTNSPTWAEVERVVYGDLYRWTN